MLVPAPSPTQRISPLRLRQRAVRPSPSFGHSSDVLVQGSTANLLVEHKKLICTEANRSWSTASDKSFNGSLSVPRYVDLVVGTESTEQNWQASYDRFCGLNAGVVAADQNASLEVQQANAQAIAEIAGCAKDLAERNGIFGLLSVTPRRDGFTISVRHRSDGASDWAVKSVRPTPVPPGFKCDDGFGEATPEAPRKVTEATWNITCHKDPATPIQVAVNTTAGALPVFDVQGLDDRLRELQEQLTSVGSRTVPSGMVVWFTEAQCPSGWEIYDDARGRVVVGADNEQNTDASGTTISKWSLAQTGGEESHTLKPDELPAYKHDVELIGIAGFTKGGEGNQALHPGPAPGTFSYRAPTRNIGDGRPHNNMPPFVALTPCVKR